MAEIVYTLCMLTSIGCAVLLLRSYARTRARLVLWCGLGFCCLAINNLLLVLDWVVLPETDLLPVRAISSVIAILIIDVGLIWETGR